MRKSSQNSKRRSIEGLFLEEYGHPALQLLLAELVYETRKLHAADLRDRYKKVLHALFGSSKKPVIDKNDRLLAEVGFLIKTSQLTPHAACDRVALQHILKKEDITIQRDYRGVKRGYVGLSAAIKRNRNKTRNRLSREAMASVESLSKKLSRKIKGKEELYAKKFFRLYIDEVEMEADFEADIVRTRGFISDWLSRYSK